MSRLARLALVSTLAFSSLAAARPGGGQSYSSGGGFHVSRGFSSGGFGSSGGGSLNLPLWAWALIFVAFVIFNLVKWLRNSDRSTRQAFEAFTATRDSPADRSDLDELRRRDPGFDPNAFLARARAIAEALNVAWCSGNMASVRRAVSDAVFTRFRTQLALDARKGVRNVMVEAAIVEVTVARLETDADWDTLHVKLIGRARDADVPVSLPPDEAQRMAQRRPLETYTEIWSFSRRLGAKTLAAGALEGRCPKCGANVPLADVIQCAFCKTLVNSGIHDWVLAEITQLVEWSPASTGKAIAGIGELKRRDPGFNREQVEDRASLLFWKWIEARSIGDGRKLARFAAVPPEQLGIVAARPGEALDRVAVGAADLVACDASPDGGFERCYVKILWSAARDRNSEPSPVSSVLILARREGQVTGEGLSSLACKGCGGPLTESDAVACEYCGASVIGGAQEWALEEVTTPQGAESARWRRANASSVAMAAAGGGASNGGATANGGAIDIPDLRDPRERILLLFRIAAVFAADGVIAPPERKLLETMARRWGVDPQVLAPALQPGAVHGPLIGIPDADHLPFLAALVVAALIDGRVDPSERKVLDQVCDSLALPPATVDQLIRSGGRVPPQPQVA